MITSLHAFAQKDLFAYKTRFIIGTASLALGTAFALVLIVLMNSLGAFAAQKATESMGVDEVLVTPAYAPGTAGITKNVKRQLDDTAVSELKALPGVVDARLENIVEYPSSVAISLFNTDFESDAAVFGIDDAQFDQLAKRKPVNPDAIPVLISKELIDIYNVGIAQAIRKPLVNEDFLTGFTFDLKLGYSSFFRDEKPATTETRKAEVVGIVSGIPIVGLTGKFSTVQDLNKRLLAEKYMPTYVRVYLRLAPGASYADIKQAIQSKSFEASSFDERLGPLRSQMAYLSLVLGGVIGIVFMIIALTIFYIFYTQYVEKRYVLAVIKTLGATSADIIKFFAYQALLMYVAAAALGLALGALVIFILRLLLNSAIGETLTGVVESILIRPGDLLMVAVLVLVVCLLCVAGPVWLANRLSPRSVLADH